MLLNLVSVLVVLVLVVLFAWLVRRAWGSRRSWLKWLGSVLAGLLTLIFAVVLVLALIGFAKSYLPASNPAVNVKVAGTPEQIAHGQRLAYICAGCHSTADSLPLDGGPTNFASLGPSGPTVGNIYPPNLTPAGEMASWTDGEIIRAIREGVHKSGRPLIIMPSQDFIQMSDEDVQALVAYLRSQPPTPNISQTDRPDNGPNILGALFLGTGMFPTSVQSPITQPIVAPPRGTSAEYGKYLISFVGCTGCHGAKLDGHAIGGDPDAPPAPNLTVIVPKWSEADLMGIFRKGQKPDGTKMSDAMPWQDYNRVFTDDDLRAIYAYLHGLTPQQASSQ